MKRLLLLGSTGSIGRQTLDVVRWHPDEFEIAGLVAGRFSETFQLQVSEFRPRYACLTSEESAPLHCPIGTTFSRGETHLVDLARCEDVDLVVVGTSGTVGFLPTLAALEAGKSVALANKETLIMAGHLVTRAAAASGAALLPIDSEHSAIWQCLSGELSPAIQTRRIILTASGGALRDMTLEEMESVTPTEALKHPTWNMGPKITIDSATLMNKGLEVIEAFWLFGVPLDRIEVVIHHQSVIHSMVEFVDGSVKAQLGPPDMRLPIQYALAHPARLATPVESLAFSKLGELTFAEVDERKYPCLALAYEAGRQGGSYPAVLNAANEVAVRRFLDGSLAFRQIPLLIQDALEAHPAMGDPDLAAVLAVDAWAKEYASVWQF